MKEIHIGSKIFFPKPEDDLESIIMEMKRENKRIRDEAPIMCSICKEVLSRKTFPKFIQIQMHKSLDFQSAAKLLEKFVKVQW